MAGAMMGLGEALMKKGRPGPAAEPMEGEDESDVRIAARDLIKAVKSGDEAGVEAALRASHLACQAEYDQAEDAAEAE